MEWIAGSATAIAAALVGWLTYRSQKEKNRSEARSDMFEDSRALANDYKEAYDDLRKEMYELREEIEGLRNEIRELIREGEMWRGVAHAAATEYRRAAPGVAPKWWPSNEPLPE